MNLNPTTPTELLCHLFERMATVQPKRVAPLELENARNWIQIYQSGLGPDPDQLPPDDRFLAQLLAIASPAQLQSLLVQSASDDVHSEKEYSWYVLQVFEKIYGFTLRAAPHEKTASLPDVT